MRPSEYSKKFPQALLILLVVCTLVVVSVSKSKEKCKRGEDDDDDVTQTLSGDNLLNYLSSKRPYDFDEKKEKRGTYLPYEDCTAIKFWYFGRHGTRNPGKKDTIMMHTILPLLRDRIVSAYDACHGTLSKKQVKKFKDWEMTKNVTIAYESHLVKQGIKELNAIGKRFRKRFPQLFSSSDSSNIQIKSTKSQRTEASSLSWAKGALNNEDVPKTLFDEPMKSDPILKFYETCSKWTEEVDENPSATVELFDFEMSTTMNKTIDRVSSKLGLFDKLSLEEIIGIYTTCAFETAWRDGKPSTWCAPFTKEDLQVLAYREDLEYYWKDGYGYRVNYEQACTPLQDLLDFMGNETKMVRAYFSHSGATLKLIARLGLYEDRSPLQSDSFSEVKSSYKWRTSMIDTMATNLAFALYECKDRPSPEIGFFFQEKPTKIPACDNNWHCSLERFHDSLSDKIGNCNFNKICTLG